MLAQRIITALIGIPIAVYIINYGQWLYAATIIFLTCAAWREYCQMMRVKNMQVDFIIGLIGIFLFSGCAWFGNSKEMVFSVIIILFVLLIKTVLFHKKFLYLDAAFSMLGILYVGFTFAHLLLLRFTSAATLISTPLGSISAGAAYLWLAFIGTWASDTFAYFVGCGFGKHKLCPSISPAKTIEGALGGLVGCVISVMLTGYIVSVPLLHSFVVGVLVGFAAPSGDLVESGLKRFVGIKDSGNFFPGHGGVLDRFDSILFAVPVVYYYIHIFWL